MSDELAPFRHFEIVKQCESCLKREADRVVSERKRNAVLKTVPVFALIATWPVYGMFVCGFRGAFACGLVLFVLFVTWTLVAEQAVRDAK